MHGLGRRGRIELVEAQYKALMLNIWCWFVRAYRREIQLAEEEMWLNPIHPRAQ